MFKASRDFVVLSLDGSRAVQDQVQAPSTLDHYMARPATPRFNSITLLEFARQYTMPKELGADPNKRSKNVVIIARPYCSPGAKYEQYCRHSPIQHKPFHQVSELLAGHERYIEAYAQFLQTENIPTSLEDIFRLEQLRISQDNTETEVI